MVKRMRKPVRRPRRKMNRKPKRKTAFKVGQSLNYNATNSKVVKFVKTALYSVNGTNNYTGTGSAISFIGGALPSSMPDWTNIIDLFNRYKLRKVTYTFNLTTTTGNNGLDGERLPKMYVRYNYNSNLPVLQVINQMQETPNVKVHQFTADKTQFSYSYYPRCLEQVYLSGITTGYKVAKQQYIDVTYGSVPHYGIMWYVDTLSTGLQINYDITWECDFKYQV